MVRPLTLAACVSSVIALAACSDSDECRPRVVETDAECKTTDDCASAGFSGLSCVNGTCGRTCVRDQDCAAVAILSDEEQERCPDLADAAPPSFVCEAQVCVNGCPDVPCAAGETCVGGRCSIFYESWEPRRPGDVVTPEVVGWNDDDRELRNIETAVVFAGIEGCARGDERCAGPPAHGSYFRSIERVPTPPQGTPELADTCRACACCRECQLLGGSAAAADLTMCGSLEVPIGAQCPASMPAICAGVCSACASCTNAPPARVIGEGLLACEIQAAGKTCPACEAPCQPGQPCPPPACTVCRDAVRCDLENPGSSECTALHQTCDQQGVNGCFSTPIARPRSQLTEDEQSIVSPAIPLSGAGDVVLSFEYVPFDIREQYRRVEQGVPMEMWRLEPQEVVLELCGGGCDAPASWTAAMTSLGARASFPRESERRNGVRLGQQSVIDWRGGRAEIAVPEALRTNDFRFRFVPKLADGVRFGVDSIAVRRRSP